MYFLKVKTLVNKKVVVYVELSVPMHLGQQSGDLKSLLFHSCCFCLGTDSSTLPEISTAGTRGVGMVYCVSSFYFFSKGELKGKLTL